MSTRSPYSNDELEARLRAIGPEKYHHRHPFHLLMHEGKLTREQLQAWVLNRYYYQSRIPIKDAIILSRSEDAEFRRAWRKRLVDHDGDGTQPGGIEKWLKLAEATGLRAEAVRSGEGVLPATRYAVEAYLDLVRNRSLLEAIASSLTELFSKDLITLRVAKLKELYPWIAGGLQYFDARMTQAPEDAAMALGFVFAHAKTRQQQELAIQALNAKCDILWAQLDALYLAYVDPGLPPPGALRFRDILRKIPVLAPGCRLKGAGTAEESAILIPEGILKLSPGGLHIVRLLDGERTVSQLLEKLRLQFPSQGAETIEKETCDFLEGLHRKKAIDWK